MENKICEYNNCNNSLESKHHNIKYCLEHQAIMRSNRKRNYNRICENCKINFISKSGRTKKCEKCMEFINCAHCNNIVKRTSGYHKYCSKECSNIAKIEHYYEGNYKKVFIRDNNKCVKCEGTKTLSVHHIDYSGFFLKKEGKVNNKLDNLILLCNICHQKLHALTNRILVQSNLEQTKTILNNFIKK